MPWGFLWPKENILKLLLSLSRSLGSKTKNFPKILSSICARFAIFSESFSGAPMPNNNVLSFLLIEGIIVYYLTFLL